MGRLIRSGEPLRRVVPAEVVDARARAAGIVAEARTHAAHVVAEARAQAASWRERAESEGLVAGQARAAAVLADAADARDRMLADAASEIPRLAVAVARRLVGRALEADPQIVREMVQSALERVRRARRLEVRVHPDDLAQVQSLVLDGERAVTFHADPSIDRGGCVVRTDVGELDARIEAQLAAVEQALSKQ